MPRGAMTMCMSEAAPPATREWLRRVVRGARSVLGGRPGREELESVYAVVAAALALVKAGEGHSYLSPLAYEALKSGSVEPLVVELSRLYGREAGLLLEARLHLERGDVEAARVVLERILDLLEEQIA